MFSCRADRVLLHLFAASRLSNCCFSSALSLVRSSLHVIVIVTCPGFEGFEYAAVGHDWLANLTINARCRTCHLQPVASELRHSGNLTRRRCCQADWRLPFGPSIFVVYQRRWHPLLLWLQIPVGRTSNFRVGSVVRMTALVRSPCMLPIVSPTALIRLLLTPDATADYSYPPSAPH